MTKISSGSSFIMKRVFPVFWFGFLIFFVGATMASAITRGPEPSDLFFLAVPAFMAIVGYIVMKQFIWDLVDVSVSTNVNPPRITLRLIHPTRFGTEVSFSPTRPFTLNPFAKNEVAESLIVRVDRARSKRAV